MAARFRNATREPKREQRLVPIVQHILALGLFCKMRAHHISIAAIGDHVQSIHNRHARRQLTVSFHIHVMCSTEFRRWGRVQWTWNRSKQRKTAFPGLFQVSLSRGTRVG